MSIKDQIRVAVVVLSTLPATLLHYYGLLPRAWATWWLAVVGRVAGVPGLAEFLTRNER